MKLCPYFEKEPEAITDPAFRYFMPALQRLVVENDAAATIFCSGPVGSGKSNLMLAAMDYIIDEPDMGMIGTTDDSFAKAYDSVRDTPGSFLAHDEANYSSRRSTSSRNEDTTALFMAVRGQNLITWMNNPSIQFIDKKFVEEGLINFFIFINKPKKNYLLFSRDSMFSFLKIYGDLKFHTLLEHGEKHADYMGCFGKVRQDLWKLYEEVKRERMRDIGDEYVEKYKKKNGSPAGDKEGYVSLKDAAKSIGVHHFKLMHAARAHREDSGMTGAAFEGRKVRLTPENVKYLGGLL